MGYFSKDWQGKYDLKGSNHGVYAFVLKGKVTIEKQLLNKRDGFGIWNSDEINISAEEETPIIINRSAYDQP